MVQAVGRPAIARKCSREVRAEIGWTAVAAEVYAKLAAASTGRELGAALECVATVRGRTGTKRTAPAMTRRRNDARTRIQYSTHFLPACVVLELNV